MNRYGRQAKEAWREAGPARYAQVQDPETFFRELGEQAAERIDQMQTRLAGPDPVGESYLEKVGPLRVVGPPLAVQRLCDS
jgi:hypothetical protein